MTADVMQNSIVALQNKPLSSYTRDEINTAKAFLNCPTATDAQWAKMCILSQQYELNPLLSEIWILPNVGVFVGLNGMLKVAIRSGQYDGIKAECYDKDGKIWNGEGHPAWAECTVWRKDSRRDYFQRVYWNEFERSQEKLRSRNPTQWDKMPGYMLEKVAKSHALKLAFNLDDLYIPEEFGRADPTDEAYAGIIDITPEPAKEEPKKPEPKQEPEPVKLPEPPKQEPQPPTEKPPKPEQTQHPPKDQRDYYTDEEAGRIYTLMSDQGIHIGDIFEQAAYRLRTGEQVYSKQPIDEHYRRSKGLL